jgi:hypothetical protein
VIRLIPLIIEYESPPLQWRRLESDFSYLLRKRDETPFAKVVFVCCRKVRINPSGLSQLKTHKLIKIGECQKRLTSLCLLMTFFLNQSLHVSSCSGTFPDIIYSLATLTCRQLHEIAKRKCRLVFFLEAPRFTMTNSAHKRN